MFKVYIIQSIDSPTKLYKGFTRLDIKEILAYHNRGKVLSTKKFSPWKIIFVASFETQELALDFEKYLKTASGIAFMRKRLINYKKY